MTPLERVLSGEFVNPGTLLGVIFYALVFLLLAWLSLRSLRVTLERLEGSLLDHTTVTFLRRMGDALIWVLALILYAHLIPELRSLGTALLTGASVASILVGLAAQSTLGNLIAGFGSAIVSAVSNRGLGSTDGSGWRSNWQDRRPHPGLHHY